MNKMLQIVLTVALMLPAGAIGAPLVSRQLNEAVKKYAKTKNQDNLDALKTAYEAAKEAATKKGSGISNAYIANLNIQLPTWVGADVAEEIITGQVANPELKEAEAAVKEALNALWETDETDGYDDLITAAENAIDAYEAVDGATVDKYAKQITAAQAWYDAAVAVKALETNGDANKHDTLLGAANATIAEAKKSVAILTELEIQKLENRVAAVDNLDKAEKAVKALEDSPAGDGLVAAAKTAVNKLDNTQPKRTGLLQKITAVEQANATLIAAGAAVAALEANVSAAQYNILKTAAETAIGKVDVSKQAPFNTRVQAVADRHAQLATKEQAVQSAITAFNSAQTAQNKQAAQLALNNYVANGFKYTDVFDSLNGQVDALVVPQAGGGGATDPNPSQNFSTLQPSDLKDVKDNYLLLDLDDSNEIDNSNALQKWVDIIALNTLFKSQGESSLERSPIILQANTINTKFNLGKPQLLD